jgi:hypothetical protein
MKQLPTILKPLCAAAIVCCALATASAQIVQDGGFESSPGSAPGTPGGFSAAWTLTPPPGLGAGQQLSNVGTNPEQARTGTRHANLEFSQGAPTAFASLSQVISTTAGTSYTLSFFLANFSASPVNFFRAVINGAVVFTTQSPPFPISGSTPNYQQIFASFIATGGSTSLEFQYRNDQDFWSLDDVSVHVPEGGAPLWLALPILGGLCLAHFRTRRAAVRG